MLLALLLGPAALAPALAAAGDTPAARALDATGDTPAAAAPASDRPALDMAAAGVGGVTVRLVDESGAAWAGLEHATLTLARGDTAVPLRPLDGRWHAAEVPAGAWELRFSAPGFLPVTHEVAIPSGDTVAVPLVVAADLAGIETLDVVEYTDAQRLTRSAQAVTVVETEEARTQSADLGEVMARSRGVGVRRSGGLGSDTRFSLDGLTDDQVRFFLDGVPLELAGYPYGIANVPVDLVERAEVYRGVVPVRFGADALGGAVNLVRDTPEGVGGSVSYQGGSFDTHRLAASAHAGDTATGLRGRVSGYLDRAANDYTIDVEVPDAVGHLAPATVRRSHDAYEAVGGAVELGLAERAWADELTLRGFASGARREIQHNVVMTVPYGEAEARLFTAGGTVTWRHTLGAVEVDALGGYTRTERAFTDLAACVYDWFGRCVLERTNPGEITSGGSDLVVWDDAVVARATARWRPSAHHGVTLSVAPTLFTRAGEDRLTEPGERDPLTSRRDAAQVVTGLEHQLDAWDERVQNLAFVKQYTQLLASEEPIPGGGSREVDRTTARVGVGDGLRVHVAGGLYAKASYEWATRLPTPEEIFGDAVLVQDNLELRPETSHNANLGVTWEVERRRLGALTVEATGFLREAKDLVVLLGDDRSFTWQNVFGARSLGAEGAVAWRSPGDRASVSLNGTWVELRNTSTEGTFGAYAGDRIPNRPWLYANATIGLGAPDLAAPGDRLSLDWYTRYVHAFYRGWESVGLAQFKQEVPAQLSHTVAVTYSTPVSDNRARLTASAEVQNLTDAALYDFFGVQRPGRAVFGKLTLSR